MNTLSKNTKDIKKSDNDILSGSITDSNVSDSNVSDNNNESLNDDELLNDDSLKECIFALDDFVTNRSNQDLPTLLQISTQCDEILDKLYRVDENKRTKYKKFMQKYIDMNATINPHLNSSYNTTYHIENEPEHGKNSGKLYKNNTHRATNK